MSEGSSEIVPVKALSFGPDYDTKARQNKDVPPPNANLLSEEELWDGDGKIDCEL
ncbi:hypothetical protein SARC_15192, partial [Sphaeroforma arctica JP610]